MLLVMVKARLHQTLWTSAYGKHNLLFLNALLCRTKLMRLCDLLPVVSKSTGRSRLTATTCITEWSVSIRWNHEEQDHCCPCSIRQVIANGNPFDISKSIGIVTHILLHLYLSFCVCSSLLQTVPSAVLDKGKAIADAYRAPVDDYVEENAAELDPRLKQLEDIL